MTIRDVPWDQPGAGPMADMLRFIASDVERSARARLQRIEETYRQALYLHDESKLSRLIGVYEHGPGGEPTGPWPASITDLGLEWSPGGEGR